MKPRSAPSPSPVVGPALLVLGGAHLVVGVVKFPGPLDGMLSDGLVGSMLPRHRAGGRGEGRDTAFWFLTTGAGLLLLGGLALADERRGQVLPRSLGYGLGALGLVGAAVNPVSPFWLFLAPAAVVLRRAG